jgi:hypothetical protein
VHGTASRCRAPEALSAQYDDWLRGKASCEIFDVENGLQVGEL